MIAALGMDPNTGRRLTGLDHIRMCIQKILTTPIGSCIERREFGSLLPELVDAPLNDVTRLQVVAASAQAILRWEPRLALQRLTVEQSPTEPAALTVSLEATVVASEQEVALNIPVRLGAQS